MNFRDHTGGSTSTCLAALLWQTSKLRVVLSSPPPPAGGGELRTTQDTFTLPPHPPPLIHIPPIHPVSSLVLGPPLQRRRPPELQAVGGHAAVKAVGEAGELKERKRAGSEGSEGVKGQGVQMEEGAGGQQVRRPAGGSGRQEPTGWQGTDCLHRVAGHRLFTCL